MDQIKWTTPIKNGNKYDFASKSPIIYKTPVKQYETSKHTPYQNNVGGFTVLPTHLTPPSGLTKFIARNPFETDLTSRLHLSVISPTVFSKVSSPSSNSPDFAWSVEELALIQPAKIEEFPAHQFHCMDPETETKAQAAIDKFFKENQIIPSPWEMRKKETRNTCKTDTPKRTSSDLNLESSKSKKDGWSQTLLSFPSELPSHVEEILKPYFTFTQEQNVESDDANSSNNSLRRKLFFNHDDYLENEEENSVCLSPVKINGSLVLPSSPPQSGMLVHGVPLKHSQNTDCEHEMSPIVSESLSLHNISPRHSTMNNMSCDSVRSRSRRLDFTTDMSIDQSNLQHKQYSNNGSLDNSLNKIGVQESESKINNFLKLDSNSTYVQSNFKETNVTAGNSIYFKHTIETEVSEFSDKHHNVVYTFKPASSSESCVFQQSSAMLGISDQQSVSNSVQDTGYQTYSMSSTANVTDSYNSTPVKQKSSWGDRILLPDDDFRLSDWKENMKNIFSSTPSRSNRERDNHIL